jgi:hypothetical protein
VSVPHLTLGHASDDVRNYRYGEAVLVLVAAAFIDDVLNYVQACDEGPGQRVAYFNHIICPFNSVAFADIFARFSKDARDAVQEFGCNSRSGRVALGV